MIHLFCEMKIGQGGWKPIETGVDDNNFLVDFLDTVEPNNFAGVRGEEVMENRAAPELTKTEKCVLFHIAGYIVNNVSKYAKIYDTCRISITTNESASKHSSTTQSYFSQPDHSSSTQSYSSQPDHSSSTQSYSSRPYHSCT
ncbi:unnamed protein product [Merluccius merluccius]